MRLTGLETVIGKMQGCLAVSKERVRGFDTEVGKDTDTILDAFDQRNDFNANCEEPKKFWND